MIWVELGESVKQGFIFGLVKWITTIAKADDKNLSNNTGASVKSWSYFAVLFFNNKQSNEDTYLNTNTKKFTK